MDNNEKLEKAKDIVRYKLLLVYEERGLQASLNMANQFLLEAAKAGKEFEIDDFGKIIRGELSELYAEVCMREYVKTHKNSFYIKSLCMPRADGKEGYTELDLTLFTEQFVMVCECKSYSGQKTLTNEGCMNIKGRTSYNVFSQNRMHLANLNPYISRHRLKSVEQGGKPYILCMFSYSKDPIEDLRTPEWRQKFRLLTEENMLDFLEGLNKTEVIWNIHGLHKTISRLHQDSAENKKKHIELSKKQRGD